MNFEFSTATRIVFGPDTINEVSAHTTELGKRVFIVTGSTNERATPLLKLLNSHNIETVIFNITGEPTTIVASEGAEKARKAECSSVIGIGGGSVLDTGKVIAALLTNSGELLDYLEVIGRGVPLSNTPAYYIAISTTAGTGTEVTRNAVLKSPEHHVKVSMRSPLLLPRLAIVDPTLTYSMSPEVTARTGLDALTQLMEAYVSNKANPLIDGICREGLSRTRRSILRAYQDGNDKQAREDMSIASLFGGLALANAKLGAVHGFAGTIGGMFDAPHGVICARLLPFVMEANVQVLQLRLPDSQVLSRYIEIALILTEPPSANVADGIAWVRDICMALHIPPLSEFGLTEDAFPEVVEKSQKASSMKGNPIELTQEELTGILEKAI